MKQSLLFATAALLLSSSASARQWNFSNWSSATYNNLMAGAFENSGTNAPTSGWSDIEKAAGTEPTAESKAKCFWEVTPQGTTEGATLVANGTAIAELEGLMWVHSANRNLAIAVDYPTTSLGTYHGASYLWLGGSKKNYFYIPNVALGTDIKIGVESHKPEEARGIELYAGSGHNTSGTKLNDADGNAVAVPTTYEEQTWHVPEDLTTGLNEDGTVDVLVYNTNGCHLYFINVMEGDEDFDASAVKVAYLYDGTYNGAKDADKNPVGWLANGGLDNDLVYAALTSYDVQTIDYSTVGLTSAELNDSLIKYDVVVLSEAVASSNELAKGTFDIVNKVPVLNLKSFFYKSGVWGVGAGNNPSPKATTITVAEDYLDDALFANVEMDEGVITLYGADPDAVNGNLVQGCTPAADGLFGTDEAIATVPSGADASYTAIHTHGTRNMYMLIPLSSDNSNMLTDQAMTLISNAVEVLAKTKSSVQKAGKPNVEQQMANNETTVSISSSATNPTIYYSIDGGDYAIYSEPFVVTKDGTVVKAYAIAHGYDTSDTTEVTISVQAQAAAPTIATAEFDGYTTITLSQVDGAAIYYSFSGVTTSAQAATYSEPIVVTEPGTIYAFSAPADQLASEVTIREFHVGGIPAVVDTVAHFTANQTDWFDNAVLHVGEESALVSDAIANGNQFGASGNASAVYYFSKNTWSYYDYNTIDSTVVLTDEGGNPIKCADGETDSTKVYYHPDANALKYITSNTDTQWIIKSQGQVITGETTLNPVKGVGNGTAGRYAHEAIDEIGGVPSTGFIDFGGKASGEPYSMRFESTSAFASGEYDIVIYMGNGSTGNPIASIETSADGENWTAIMDTINYTTSQRYYKKTRKHVNFTEPQYIRVVQTAGSSKGYIYDIYVIRTEGTTGIEAITANDEKSAKSQYVIDLMGRRAGAMVPGQMYLKDGKTVIVR